MKAFQRHLLESKTLTTVKFWQEKKFFENLAHSETPEFIFAVPVVECQLLKLLA